MKSFTLKLFTLIYRTLYKKVNMVAYCKSRGMKIGKGTKLKNSVNISTEPYLISIGNDCKITAHVNFLTHDGGPWIFRKEYPNLDIIKPISVGNNVYIGLGATLMPGVSVGNNCVIAAMAVVTKDIPDNSVVAGVPARVVKDLSAYKEKCLRDTVNLKGCSTEQKKQRLIETYPQK
jgi:acetyltransferase-like isoleucine patch superfamily enzyme